VGPEIRILLLSVQVVEKTPGVGDAVYTTRTLRIEWKERIDPWPDRDQPHGPGMRTRVQGDPLRQRARVDPGLRNHSHLPGCPRCLR
jgi:hypothetical protein